MELNLFKRNLARLTSLTEAVLCVMVSAMVVIVFMQVIYRFVLRDSLPWSEEAARYLMVWIAMLGGGLGIRYKAHVGVEAVYNLFPNPAKRLLSILIYTVGLTFFAAMVGYSWKLVQVVMPQESPAMEISMGIPYSALIVGGCLMFLFTLDQLGDVLFSWNRGAGS